MGYFNSNDIKVVNKERMNKMKKVISLFVAILSVLIFTDNANAENNKPEGVNENSNLIPVRQPDAQILQGQLVT